MFFLWIALVILFVIGVSVLIGRMMSPRAPRTREPMSRAQKVEALKMSGAMQHRKSNR